MPGPENPTTGAVWTYLPWDWYFWPCYRPLEVRTWFSYENSLMKKISRILYQSLLLNILTKPEVYFIFKHFCQLIRHHFCFKLPYFSCKVWNICYALMVTLQWRIQSGHASPPFSPNYLIFLQFSAEILQNNRLAHRPWGVGTPLSEKPWILHFIGGFNGALRRRNPSAKFLSFT